MNMENIWSKTSIKHHTLCEFIRWKCSEQANPQRHKLDWWLSKPGEDGVIGANKYGVYSGGDENVLEWTVMMVVQLCEYTKHYWSVYFKWVNCVVWELYLNKADIKNTKEEDM